MSNEREHCRGGRTIYYCIKVQITSFEHFQTIILNHENNNDDLLFDLEERLHDELDLDIGS